MERTEQTIDPALSDWNKAIGFDDDDDREFTNTALPGGKPGDDIAGKLGEIEKGNNPTPPTLPTLGGDTELSEDLKSIESDLKLSYELEDATDYKALMKENFGIEAETVSREDYMNRAYMTHYQQEYLSGFDITGAQAVIDGKIAKDTVLQNDVMAALKGAKIFTQRNYEEQMAELIVEGKLTEEGERRYNEIVEAQKTQLTLTQAKAQKYAEGKVKEFQDHSAALVPALKNFKPMGLQMEDAWYSHLEEVIKGGHLSAYVNGQEGDTPEQIAKREVRMAVAASDKAFSELLKTVYEKGVKHGVAKKATKLFK